MNNLTSHDKIAEKISAMKRDFPSLRTKNDSIVFTALCVRANFYKNPSFNFSENEIESLLTDGQYDGGIDAMFSDPNSEESNLVLVQSKYYKNITYDNVSDAVQKMFIFYKDMQRGEYQNVNSKVQQQFLSLNAEVGEESKVCFVFYTSANQNGIRKDRIEKLLKHHFNDTSIFEVSILFADDIIEEIKELESRRPTVESGEILIDQPKNVLNYNEEAVIVNASAFSIKNLYALNGINLLSRNLRYFINKRDIDTSIRETIKEQPDQFWFRNNGITIICDDFEVDGRKVRLSNFSIVNGGQTTTLLHKSSSISKENDLFLPCKIIRAVGDDQDKKNEFILNIAKATNSQKPIKQIDLKSNSPEQVRFVNSMREQGVFYQTKRGEKIPINYKDEYSNTNLADVGKLCLAGLFQLPASSRNRPSSLYNDKYYNVMFHGAQESISILVKHLLYINYFFQKIYINKFSSRFENHPISPIAFANNARTICIAFTILAARYIKGNIDDLKLKTFFLHSSHQKDYDDYLYNIFIDINDVKNLFPPEITRNRDIYEKLITCLFDAIILSGFRYYQIKKDDTMNESNFLKNDFNYYAILKADWPDLSAKIITAFREIECLV